MGKFDLSNGYDFLIGNIICGIVIGIVLTLVNTAVIVKPVKATVANLKNIAEREEELTKQLCVSSR